MLSCYPGNDIQTIIATAEHHLEDTVWSLAVGTFGHQHWISQSAPTLLRNISSLCSLLSVSVSAC